MIYIHPTSTHPSAIAALEQQTGLRAAIHQCRAVLVPKNVLMFAGKLSTNPQKSAHASQGGAA